MKTSLIILTYNQPEFLNIVLQSVIEQTRLPEEIIIADDGSDETTAEVVRSFMTKTSVPILHTYHPHNGFRVMLARNNAAAVSSGDYLIFIDGDCFLHPCFIADHQSFAETNHYAAGRRVNIRQKRREYILRTGNRSISLFSWGTGKKLHSIRSRFLSYLRQKSQSGGMASANFGVWKSDFEKVNGFNERLAGYSGCDYEIAQRLENSGVKRKLLVHWGIAYHFDHPLTKRVRWSENAQHNLIRQVLSEEKERCCTGLNRAAAEGVQIINR
ncbi:MAG: glycosyltransferase [Planctomycetaceae bacterium]|nr:glycosyltransferase [Planctomycetaceae bacterium]